MAPRACSRPRMYVPMPKSRTRRTSTTMRRGMARYQARAKTARGHGGAAETNAAGIERRIHVERNGVLVDGDAGAVERGLGLFAANAFGENIHQHQMRVGAVGDDVEA